MFRHTIVVLLALASGIMAAERDTAEWVIRNGGRVDLDGSRTPVHELLALPQGEIHITGVDLLALWSTRPNSETCANSRVSKSCTSQVRCSIRLSGSRLDANAQLKFLSTLKSLEKLSFSLHF